jgi:hypothetical protein
MGRSTWFVREPREEFAERFWKHPKRAERAVGGVEDSVIQCHGREKSFCFAGCTVVETIHYPPWKMETILESP